jgi:hypothetical protein
MISKTSGWSSTVSIVPFVKRAPRARQLDDAARAFVRAAVHWERTAARLADQLRDGGPQPGPVEFTHRDDPLRAIEHEGQAFGRNADTVISNGQSRATANLPTGCRESARQGDQVRQGQANRGVGSEVTSQVAYAQRMLGHIDPCLTANRYAKGARLEHLKGLERYATIRDSGEPVAVLRTKLTRSDGIIGESRQET